jgi:hypothetical protein
VCYLRRCVLVSALSALGLAMLLGSGLAAGRPLPRPPALSVAQAADEASTQASEPSALVVSSTNAPYRVTANDGMAHLEYDLILTSVFPAAVTVESVDVIDPAGNSLMHLEGSNLTRQIQQVYNTGAPAENFDAENVASVGAVTQVPVGGTLAIVMDVVVPPEAVPAQISHRITYALPADNPFLALVNARTIVGPNLTLSTHDPIVLSPPVRGAGWYAVDACCDPESGHRAFRSAVDGARIAKTETFAYDYLRVKNGRLFDGDGSRNDQWYDYGAEVVAAADGTVVFARDGMPEAMPGQTSPAVQSAVDYQGNNVVVQIRPDVWATYAHLQPGSVKVQVGDHVTAGQLLGLLGSTGNSPIAPHLHFQLSDGPVIATSDSLPFEFDHYTLAGSINEEDLAFVLANRDQPELPIRGTPQPQSNTYALNGTIQDFP